MGKYYEDCKTDEMHYTQFDRSINEIAIDKLKLTNNRKEEQRIKDLIKCVGDDERYDDGLILFDWYVVYHFFKNGYEANLQCFDFDDFNKALEQCGKALDGCTNLVIIEVKTIENFYEIDKLINGKNPDEVFGTFALKITNDLKTKYRINYIYK